MLSWDSLESNGLFVDHINGDTLDNRKNNLRICTRNQNAANRRTNINREFKGVRSSPKGKVYKAQVSAGRIEIVVKGLLSKEEAAAWYDKIAPLLHGEYARLNLTNDKD